MPLLEQPKSLSCSWPPRIMGEDYGVLGFNVFSPISPQVVWPRGNTPPGCAVTRPLLSLPAPPWTYSCEDPGCPVWIIPGQNWKAKARGIRIMSSQESTAWEVYRSHPLLTIAGLRSSVRRQSDPL